MPTYEGQLELTWTNKSLRLLAHENGQYEWLAASDYRVAEVRLLSDAGAVGEVHSTKSRAKDNLLIRGDALNGLTESCRATGVRARVCRQGQAGVHRSPVQHG